MGLNEGFLVQHTDLPSEWSQVRMIFGRLIGVDKKKHCITVEYKRGDTWQSETFDLKESRGYDDQVFEEFAANVGEDVEFRAVDNEVIFVSTPEI